MEIPGGVKAHRALVSLQRDKHTEKSGSGPPKVEQFLQVVLHFVCTILHIRFDYMVFIHGRPIYPKKVSYGKQILRQHSYHTNFWQLPGRDRPCKIFFSSCLITVKSLVAAWAHVGPKNWGRCDPTLRIGACLTIYVVRVDKYWQWYKGYSSWVRLQPENT